MASFEIRQRNGRVHTVLADDSDLERVLAAGPWHIKPDVRTTYVQRIVGVRPNRNTETLHRFVLTSPDLHVDHTNGDGLDNRRSNLRVCPPAKNQGNARRRSDNAVGFKGVTRRKRDGRYQAQIMVDGRRRHLGYFDTPEEAHAAYCRAATAAFGQFARFE